MRYPVVLFDLDGTVIDSGSIILASMRHAAQTVLGREIPDEQLVAAWRIEARMIPPESITVPSRSKRTTGSRT